jgi:para-nitrobenzyl esterase
LGAGAAPRTAAAAAAPASGVFVETPGNEVVETVAGKVRGHIRNGIHTFKGIPYAETAGGANRFLPPQKLKPWAGTFGALAWGPVCYQGVNSQWYMPEFKFMLEWDNGINGENCLCLNVWTPAIRDNKKRPVMVWLHGGGFSGGSSQEFPSYDGESTARRGDVVMVSVNHRLNLFGFLNLAGVGGERYAGSGAAGMLDLVAALEWVRDNITQFGGDPGNVTIFGQSGGGGKVTNLMAMPSARGLFHKAITQSGGGFTRNNNKEATERLGAAAVAELGLTAATLSRIAEVPVYDLQQAVDRATTKLRQYGQQGALAPLTDGNYILTGQGVPAVSAAIPLMFGGTSGENPIAIFDPAVENITEEAMIANVERTNPGKGRAIVATYRQAFPNEKPVDILQRIGAYGFTGRGIIQSSELLTAPNSGRTAPAWRWLFDWRTPALDGRIRAQHCSEIAFVFNNTDKSNPAAAGGAAAVDLSQRMNDAWTSFARTGDPNHRGLPRWEPISATRWPTMVFNTPPRVEDMIQSAERRAFMT